MSQENVQIALAQIEAANRRDVDAVVALVSPDVEWEDSVFPGLVGTYRGRAEVRKWFNQAAVEPWDSLHLEVEEITEPTDGRVFLGVLLTTSGKGSGVETQLNAWFVNWIANGKITRRQVFLDRDEALEAAGMRE